ncbi:NACHT domain-containing protein [Kutzneria sp. NPDC052558]|uniref:NACHT domain-containing protein n=1 Tax=Kutzneria sp. NPDC052558 TaxID=3364121 RepID=UPI0037C6F891
MAGTGRWVARGSLLAAAVGVPVLASFQPLAVDQPALTVVTMIGYEALLAVVAFAGDIGGELAKRWRGRAVEWLDQELLRRVSGFGRRYRKSMLEVLRHIDDKGFVTVGFYSPELDEVFVDVGLAPQAPHNVPAGVLSDDRAEPADELGIARYLADPNPAVIAIIGGPGTGKTTLLLHTAWQLCRSPRGRSPRSTPVLLFLRDHAKTIAADPGVALPAVVGSTLGDHGQEATAWFERRLAAGDCVVLLDGLDEVASQGDRLAVAAWVERQIKRFPRNDFLVTSRPHGYLAARIEGATVLQMRRLTEEQAADFVRRWYLAHELALERYRKNQDFSSARRRAAAAAESLLVRLKDAPALYDLTANPMLLTMIANVHRFRGELPDSRWQLYAEICQVMLGRRPEAKLSGDRKELLLRALAFTMMTRRVRDLPADAVLSVFEPELCRLPRELTAAEALADIATNGLLIERENGLYSFAHVTFQEYLAASHIRENGLVAVLTEAVDDVWWRETTLLYAARADADPIIRACLESDGVAALMLAFDCAAQPSAIAPELRDRLARLLDSVFDPDTDPRRRRFLVGVMVTSHLRRLAPAGDTVRGCSRPVTTTLYRLFLQEVGRPPPEESWKLDWASDDPVQGVHGQEAAAFLRWVDSILGGEPALRLPTREEVEHPPFRRTLTAPVWLHGPELWTPTDEHPHAVTAEVLVRYVTADIQRLTSTLARLLLIRSVVALPALARARAVALDSALPLDTSMTKDLNQGLELARELDSALNLTHALDLSRDLDIETLRALTRTRSRARELARDSKVDFARALARAPGNDAVPDLRASDTASSSDKSLAHDLMLELVRDLAHGLGQAGSLVGGSVPARALALDLALIGASNLAHGLVQVLGRVHALDSVFARALGELAAPDPDHDLPLFMGSALSIALRGATPTKAADWHALQADFARHFVEVTGIDALEHVVSPDSLAELVRDGRRQLVDGVEPGPRSWDPREVAARLEEIALPVFTGQRPITAETAAAIRLAALCLAVEADHRGMADVGAGYRRLAAGVTLVERRLAGDVPTTEMIVLAVKC